MLMMIGRLSNTNTEFVSASIMADYHLAVRCFSIRPSKGSYQYSPLSRWYNL